MVRSWSFRNSIAGPPSPTVSHTPTTNFVTPAHTYGINQQYTFQPATDYKSNVVKYLAQQRHGIYGYQQQHPFSINNFASTNVVTAAQQYYSSANLQTPSLQQQYNTTNTESFNARNLINGHSPVPSSSSSNYQQLSSSLLFVADRNSLSPAEQILFNSPVSAQSSIDRSFTSLPSKIRGPTPNIVINAPGEITKLDEPIEIKTAPIHFIHEEANRVNTLSPLEEELDYRTFGEKIVHDHYITPSNIDISSIRNEHVSDIDNNPSFFGDDPINQKQEPINIVTTKKIDFNNDNCAKPGDLKLNRHSDESTIRESTEENVTDKNLEQSVEKLKITNKDELFIDEVNTRINPTSYANDSYQYANDFDSKMIQPDKNVIEEDNMIQTQYQQDQNQEIQYSSNNNPGSFEYRSNYENTSNLEDCRSYDPPISDSQFYPGDESPMLEGKTQQVNLVYNENSDKFQTDEIIEQHNILESENVISNPIVTTNAPLYGQIQPDEYGRSEIDYEVQFSDTSQPVVQEETFNKTFYDSNISQANADQTIAEPILEKLVQEEQHNLPTTSYEEQTAVQYSQQMDYETSPILTNPEYEPATATEYVVDENYNNESNQNYEQSKVIYETPINYDEHIQNQQPAHAEFNGDQLVYDPNNYETQSIYDNQSNVIQEPQVYYDQNQQPSYDEKQPVQSEYYQQEYNNRIESQQQQSSVDYQNYVTQSSEQYSNDPYYSNVEPGANYYSTDQEQEPQPDLSSDYYNNDSQKPQDRQLYATVDESEVSSSTTYNENNENVLQTKPYEQKTFNPNDMEQQLPASSEIAAPLPTSDSDFDFPSSTN